ncbi:hypothetical protein [Bilophila wadsworthia]|uniref:hypothetical protein n=2 Tax=Bilophila wadsworthia TaxID=35833 RepID=UPI00321FF024
MGQCTAKSKRTGERCRRAAMHGQTVCYMHGGASRRKGGAPKGSKNALKTGQYETILASTMTPEELSYRDSLDINPLTTLRETLKTLRMRELRILCRIMKAMDAEEIAGTPTGKMNGQGKELLHPAMLLIGAQQTKKADGNDATTSQSESHARYIERLENALTAVQDQIRRVSDSLARMEGEGGEESRNGVAIVLDLDGGRRHEGDGN